MDCAQFGQTDLHVSRIASGTWSFAGDWGAVQVEESNRGIRKALPGHLEEIERIMRDAVQVGGPSPEAMP
jgi:hypothetical protein